MERRSRSQVRRIDNGLSTVSSRHASTTRADQPPLDPARTLSPDRKDRYRSSGRGNGNGGGFNGYAPAPGGNVLYNGQMNSGNYPPQPDIMAGQGGIHLPEQPHGQHSNSNSYNQYTHNPPPIISTNPASLPPQSNVNGYGEYRPQTNGPLNGHNGGSNVNNGVIGSVKGSLNHSENSNTLTSQVRIFKITYIHFVFVNVYFTHIFSTYTSNGGGKVVFTPLRIKNKYIRLPLQTLKTHHLYQLTTCF